MPTDKPAESPIVVCLKWVTTRPEIDPLTGTVSTDERFSGISPADQAALEWALRLGNDRSVTVTAVTVGPVEAEGALRQALAHGAERAHHVRTDRPDGHDNTDNPTVELDSHQVAQALAPLCRAATMVLCGDHSLDRGSGSVPAFLAAELGIAQALGCVGLEIGSRELRAERRLDQGRRELLAIEQPTVLSFEGGLELRRAGLAATMTAADNPTEAVALPDAVAADPAGRPVITAAGPYRPRPRVLAAPTGSTLDRLRQLTGADQEQAAAQQLELPPAEAATAVVEQLAAWGYLSTDEQPDH